jgi:hypothetical protein
VATLVIVELLTPHDCEQKPHLMPSSLITTLRSNLPTDIDPRLDLDAGDQRNLLHAPAAVPDPRARLSSATSPHAWTAHCAGRHPRLLGHVAPDAEIATACSRRLLRKGHQALPYEQWPPHCLHRTLDARRRPGVSAAARV